MMILLFLNVKLLRFQIKKVLILFKINHFSKLTNKLSKYKKYAKQTLTLNVSLVATVWAYFSLLNQPNKSFM